MNGKPNLFIIGAPKCGTTSLAGYLGQHPDVFLSRYKEPRFFNKDFGDCRDIDLQAYESLYESERAYKYYLDATPCYLMSEVALNGIKNYAEDPRFIVMFRDPVSMFFSLHDNELRGGNENIKDSSAAWKLSDARRDGKQMPPLCKEKKKIDYKSRGMTGDQLARAIRQFDRGRFYVIELNALKHHPDHVWRDLLNFLDLEECADIDFTPKNVGKRVSSIAAVQIIRRASIVRKALHLPRLKLGTRIQSLFLTGKSDQHNPNADLCKEITAFYKADYALMNAIANSGPGYTLARHESTYTGSQNLVNAW